MGSGEKLIFSENLARAVIVPPEDEVCGRLAGRIVNRVLEEDFGFELPVDSNPHGADVEILTGNALNHPGIRRLQEAGLVDLRTDGLGDEGFRVASVNHDGRSMVLVLGNTAVALKHGLQELVLFRVLSSPEKVCLEWPLHLERIPAFAYRGVYMLPCWSAHDSVEHWKRVLRFHSELTLNRNWFWVAGFPLLPQYGGDYEGMPLADPWAVRDLLELCHEEEMKMTLGGGWFNWHHERHSGGDMERGVQYYRDLLDLFPEADGLYIEPTGEGRKEGREVWGEQIEAMQGLFEELLKKNPDLEFSIAIGEFNDEEYLRIAHEMAGGQVYWWWCWGDPVRDKAMAKHDRVLRWHTCHQMSEYHGSMAPPQTGEQNLAGFATSYDPGMGFGNPWNGWGNLGADAPREVDPRTMPFFSHQYLFRERCWNPEQTESEFAARMQRRLFDVSLSAEAVDLYLELASYCPDPKGASPSRVDEIDEFVREHEGKGTRRNQDTFVRMREAIQGIRDFRDRQD